MRFSVWSSAALAVAACAFGCGESADQPEGTETPAAGAGFSAAGADSAGAPPTPIGGSGADGGTDAGGMAGLTGAGDAGQAGEAGADSGGAPVRPPYEWVGVIGTGQSLSVGVRAGYISPAEPYGNLVLRDDGPDPKYPLTGGKPQWSVVPLKEPVRAKVAGTGPGYTDQQYPNNILGETPHSGMADTLSWLWQERGNIGEYVTAHSVVGWSGHCLYDIDKAGGKRAYPASINEARVLKRLADQQKKSFGYGAITMTHGECDRTNTNYGKGLYQLLRDYNTDLKPITKQTRDVVMLISQQSTKDTGPDGSAVQVFRAGREHPGELICTGPKYQYQYAADKLHLQAAGYRRLGEKYAEVFDAVVNRGVAWQPLGPISAKRTGNVIAVAFHVPAPPLVWSTHIAAPHQGVHTEWAKGRGFEVATAQGTAVTIASVAIQANTVLITLQSPPAGALEVAYALTQDAEGNQGGDVRGLRGQLRDSDDFVGADAETIAVQATQGSATVTSVTPGSFRRRTGFDVLTEGGQRLPLVLSSRDSDDELTLSGPWSSPSGTHTLTFNYDLYNYAVHFSMPVE